MATNIADITRGLVPDAGAISVAVGTAGQEPEVVGSRPGLRFASCSTAKPVTAVAVLIAAELGWLSLDDEPAPGLPVRSLLSHTSGLAGDAYDWPPSPEAADPLRSAVERDVPRLPRIAAGQYWYSNVGYQLLGLALADAAGHPFDRVLTRLVLEPYGMVDTSVGDPTTAAGCCPPLDPASGAASRPFRFNPAQIAGGALVTTAADMVRFATRHLLDERLSPESRALLATPATRLAGPNHPAAGWSVRHDRGIALLTTGGGYGSYGATGALNLDTGEAAWAMFNHPGGYSLDVAALVGAGRAPDHDPLALAAEPTPGWYRNPWGGVLAWPARGGATLNGRPLKPGASVSRSGDSVLVNEIPIIIGSTPYEPGSPPTGEPLSPDHAGRYTAPFDQLDVVCDATGATTLRSGRRGALACRPLDGNVLASDLGVIVFAGDHARLSDAYVFDRA